ncbi:hypothetical protein KFL_000440080 [Klebsormidium nitens]|uniref:Uncharacterized protein n=1 Tax=Klebsormidium nitens TaxID=105231 RepID=A0A1Y1HU04_KLENI|nr:hypothetical protein KFL_000440080 [Klebsormidium nitens]|eukprot:GAQ80006.1 hypothetical protein KFL_000440080 [Klebsormidium nitens]
MGGGSLSFAERHGPFPSDAHYIMVIGASGAGKSTFINTVVNFFRGGSLDPFGRNLRVAIPNRYFRATEAEGKYAKEMHLSNVKVAKTDECTPYHFKYQGQRVTLVDTPGLADIRGMEQDDLNLNKIFEAAESLPHLNALIIVANGSNQRLDATMKNVFARFRGSIPDVTLNSVLVVLTNCDRLAKNFDIETLNEDLPGVTVTAGTWYCMQNSAFSSHPDTWAQPENAPAFALLQAAWQISMDMLETIMQKILKMASESTGAFKELREKRNEIKAKMASALTEFRNMQMLEDKLERSQYDLEGAVASRDNYKDFARTETVEEVEQIPCGYHNTLCSTCQQVCHEKCGLEFISEAGGEAFNSCACMGGGSACMMCPGACGAASHYHGLFTIQKVRSADFVSSLVFKSTSSNDISGTFPLSGAVLDRKVHKTIEKVMEEIKKKFDAANAQLEGAKTEIGSAKSDLDLLRAAQAAKLEEIKQLCRDVQASSEPPNDCGNGRMLQGVRLFADAIVSGFNFVDELATVLDSLRMEKRQLLTIKAREDAEATIRDLEAFINGLNTAQGGNAGGRAAAPRARNPVSPRGGPAGTGWDRSGPAESFGAVDYQRNSAHDAPQNGPGKRPPSPLDQGVMPQPKTYTADDLRGPQGYAQFSRYVVPVPIPTLQQPQYSRPATPPPGYAAPDVTGNGHAFQPGQFAYAPVPMVQANGQARPPTPPYQLSNAPWNGAQYHSQQDAWNSVPPLAGATNPAPQFWQASALNAPYLQNGAPQAFPAPPVFSGQPGNFPVPVTAPNQYSQGTYENTGSFSAVPGSSAVGQSTHLSNLIIQSRHSESR